MPERTEVGVCVAEDAAVALADRWGGHQLLLGHEDDRVELARWAEQGLTGGDTLLFAADEPHPDTTALVATLRAHGVDAAGAADDGRLVVVDPGRFYDLAGYEQLVDRGLREGAGGVRSFGGPQVAADVLDPPGFAAFERLLERLWTTRGASALCCYPHTRAEALHEAVRRHGSGWGRYLLHLHHREGNRWAVHGEVDAANDDLFATLLAAAADRTTADRTIDRTADGRVADGRPGADPPDGPVLVLDCTGLAYGGVAAWRSAVAGTTAFRAGGGRVALTGLRPHIERILQMTGFATVFDLPDARGEQRGR